MEEQSKPSGWEGFAPVFETLLPLARWVRVQLIAEKMRPATVPGASALYHYTSPEAFTGIC
jgi:hypothetical protein